MTPAERIKFAEWLELRASEIEKHINELRAAGQHVEYRYREYLALFEAAQMIRKGLNPLGYKEG